MYFYVLLINFSVLFCTFNVLLCTFKFYVHVLFKFVIAVNFFIIITISTRRTKHARNTRTDQRSSHPSGNGHGEMHGSQCETTHGDYDDDDDDDGSRGDRTMIA